MPILREGGGCPIEFRTDRPVVAELPDQATLNIVDTTATQTLTNKTLTNPTISGNTPVSVTSATVALGTTHANRVAVFNRATGIAATLPLATGTGNVYEIFVATTFTGTATITTAQTTDKIKGTATLFQDGAGDAVVGFNTTNATTMTLFATGNTTGGIVGASIIFTDVDTNVWAVRYVSDAGGTETSPFS